MVDLWRRLDKVKIWLHTLTLQQGNLVRNTKLLVPIGALTQFLNPRAVLSIFVMVLVHVSQALMGLAMKRLFHYS